MPTTHPPPTLADKARVLGGALLIQLILGTVYGYSVFWEPLSSEVFPDVITLGEAAERGLVESEAVVVVADAAEVSRVRAAQAGYLKYAFSICILSFALVMVFAGRIQDVRGPRFPALVGAALLGVGFIIAGVRPAPIVFHLAHAALCGALTVVMLMLFHAVTRKMDPVQNPMVRFVPMGIVTTVVVAGVVMGNQFVGRVGGMDRVFLLWGTIGLLAGAGIGFAYVSPIATLVKWFPKHKGLVSGIAVAGFGGGAFLFKGSTFGAVGHIQQHGIHPFFFTHGIVCWVAVTIGALLLKNPPGGNNAPSSRSDSHWQDTLRSPVFYLLWVMFFSGAMSGLMIIGILKPFVTERLSLGGLDPVSAAAAGTAAVGSLALCNAAGRVVWGLLSDRIGRTLAFVLLFALQAATLLMLVGLSGELALIVATGLIGFNFGGNFALFPSATADWFGAKNMGSNYGWVFTSYGIAAVVGVAAGNTAKTVTGSYSAAFIISATLCLAAAACALWLGHLERKRSTNEGNAPC